MRKSYLGFLLVMLGFSPGLKAQTNYSNFSQQSARIATLAKNYPNWIKTKSLTKTAGGKDIWMITVGGANADKQPAIAILGGVEGSHLLGTELAIGFAESLMQASNSDSIKALLNNTTFYIFPILAPMLWSNTLLRCSTNASAMPPLPMTTVMAK
jgi:Zinc carboxypeptidase.